MDPQYPSPSGSKDFQHGDTNHLERSLTIDPDVFEKLFLSPKNAVKGDLRGTFGNPTPLALMGFVVALSPLSADLMGWRSGPLNLGAASTPAYYWFGGLSLIVAGILEFLLGNTFPFVVFMGYGAWFLTYAATLHPFFEASAAYATASDPTGANSPGFLASFAFVVVFMAVLSFLFLICSLRTNAVFVLIFIGALMGFAFAAAGLFALADGDVSRGTMLLKGAGGSFFCAAMFGWYLLLAVMLTVLDFPFALPVFDLSTLIKGYSEIQKEKEAKRA